MNSSLFSRDTILKRQGRTARTRRIADLSHSDSLRGKSLNIIPEEDESRVASRSPSPMPSCQASTSTGGSRTMGLKARRRLANMSDIKIARQILLHDDNDLSLFQGDLLTSPRLAPKTPSPEASPNSFKTAFEAVATKFPSPPSPLGFFDLGSPTSSLSSSPCSRTGAMPLTPSTSDDELSFVNPYHVEIQPLVIMKHSQRPSSPFREVCIIEQPMKKTNFTPAMYDSDSDSDSEWYSRELSKIITLRSPSPPSNFSQHRISRPDSVISVSPTPSAKRRIFKGLPPTPLSMVDQFAACKRARRRSVIPNYPPPPPPVVEQRPPSISSAKSVVDFPLTPVRTIPAHRPLPRSSVPADFIFESDVDESSSAFSFSIYEVDLGDDRSPSTASAYSQPSFVDAFAAQDVTFDFDGGMMLPVSLPTTPFDIDIDAELRAITEDELEFVFDEDDEVSPTQSSPIMMHDSPLEITNDLFLPAANTPFFPAFPSLPCHLSSTSGSPPASAGIKHHVYMEEHVLKSKWSTSTLASVHEEHEHRGASSKLRLYFGGQSSSKRGSSQSTKKSSMPQTPTSPFGGLMSPKKSSRGFAAAMTDSGSPNRQASASPQRGQHARGSSDSPVLGYGAHVGVRRRRSVATVSDAGSEESSSSTSSSGLRRKPIPVEMFLRSAA